MLKLPEYLHYHNNTLYLNDMNLVDLIKKYGDSLEIINLNTIPKQIKKMNNYFNNAIKSNYYLGKYHYAYACKANYEAHILKEAVKNVNFIETSSVNDLSIIKYLIDTDYINKDYTIICNGFKTSEYIAEIIKIYRMGYNIIPIMENIDELNNFMSYDIPMKIGIRFDVDFFKNTIIKNPEESRFGFLYPEFVKCISKLKKSKLVFEVFHFHMNGSIDSILKYIRLLKKLLENNFIPLKKEFSSLKYFDIGGGMPVSYLLDEEIDYEMIVNNIVKVIKDSCEKAKISMPDIIGEHGRYTVADSTFNIFKVNFVKNIYRKKKWYVLNNSIVNCLPDTWICRQPFPVLPINLLENKQERVLLGGPTCDPDDVYYYQEKKEYLNLPSIKDGQKLYIGFFKTGAYQLMERSSGAHHCLISEPARLLVDNNEIIVLKNKQNSNDLLKDLFYKK